mmetsp:Transcript_6264/g.13433  ORF Transcript_6264/g.13433 Transcript_6264/m.13433 type:complete len:94 (+) Transcript_6264:186-467(+)
MILNKIAFDLIKDQNFSATHLLEMLGFLQDAWEWQKGSGLDRPPKFHIAQNTTPKIKKHPTQKSPIVLAMTKIPEARQQCALYRSRPPNHLAF